MKATALKKPRGKLYKNLIIFNLQSGNMKDQRGMIQRKILLQSKHKKQIMGKILMRRLKGTGILCMEMSLNQYKASRNFNTKMKMVRKQQQYAKSNGKEDSKTFSKMAIKKMFVFFCKTLSLIQGLLINLSPIFQFLFTKKEQNSTQSRKIKLIHHLSHSDFHLIQLFLQILSLFLNNKVFKSLLFVFIIICMHLIFGCCLVHPNDYPKSQILSKGTYFMLRMLSILLQHLLEHNMQLLQQKMMPKVLLKACFHSLHQNQEGVLFVLALEGFSNSNKHP